MNSMMNASMYVCRPQGTTPWYAPMLKALAPNHAECCATWLLCCVRNLFSSKRRA